MIVQPTAANASGNRAGITLTEILISILIMGIGMVSLATLFPLGLLKLRDAARMSRSAYLAQSAAADLAARGLLSKSTYRQTDVVNLANTLPLWYASTRFPGPNAYDPFTQDTPSYGGDPFDTIPPTVYYGVHGTNGLGLPFAYDPLWRWQTGLYLDPIGKTTQEARFATGNGFVRADPSGGRASVDGLQRLTNFNPPAVTPIANYVPSIFVSPEDTVWQDASFKGQYPMAGILNLTDPFTRSKLVDSSPSGLVPDLSQDFDSVGNPRALSDWRYTWMFTGRQVSAGSATGATFDGDVVIFENRPFSLDTFVSPINNRTIFYQAAGEQVVEGVFGYSSQVIPVGTTQGGLEFGYGAGAGKTVLLRWLATATDPEVKVGGWIADVTYERNATIAFDRFALSGPPLYAAIPPTAQRCHWYQVVKVNPAEPAVGTLAFGSVPGTYRSMVVNVATPLRAYTQLDPNTGYPVHVTPALVSPHVVQVIPRTFTVN